MKQIIKKIKQITMCGILCFVSVFSTGCDIGFNDLFSLGVMPDQEEGQDMFSYLADKLLVENKDSIITLLEGVFMEEIREMLISEGVDAVLKDEEMLSLVRDNLLNDQTLREEIKKELIESAAFRDEIADELLKDEDFMDDLIASEEFQKAMDAAIDAAVEEALREQGLIRD